MTVTLGIDTASDSFALVLARDGEVVASIEEPAHLDHSRSVLAAIDRLVESRPERIDHLVVVRGPGAYAGLRVGIAIAQGVAVARGIPVSGVGTLEAVAKASQMDPVSAIHPVGRGEFAVQSFADGRPQGAVRLALPVELGGTLLAGERASELGGVEIGPEARCIAAVAIALARQVPAGDVDAIYVREPNTTRPRRTPLVPGRQE